MAKDQLSKKDIIGSRWREVLERIDKLFAEYKHKMSSSEKEYLTDIKDKLTTWEARTFITATQLNRLTRIEADLARSQFNRY